MEKRVNNRFQPILTGKEILMSVMETFYKKLFAKKPGKDPYIRALTKLTQTNPERLKVLKDTPGWEPWFTLDEKRI